MCGLLLAPSAYSYHRIEQALDRMAYRGDGEPGHKTIAHYGSWAIGHVRLAIQDRSERANQPRFDSKGMTAFVGEFFGCQIQGEMDYLRWLLCDEDRFHGADGFWAVAHVLGEQARVYTDHLGIKPLYYWARYNLVCSEIEPMFALEARPPLDRTYLSNCIKFGYDYSGRTPYEGIQQLHPGVCLHLDGVLPQARTYWKWHLVPQPIDLRGAILTAITNRLIGDRSVALLLSGGLDSSIIYYSLLAMGREVEAFSVENGESEYLPEGVHPLPLASVSVEEALKVMKAPLDLGSMVPQVQLAGAVAAEGYHICLTGDGADEVFGGYRRARDYDSQHSDVFCELPFYHLPRLDRVMMNSTIELRSPYLSPAVVAYGLRIPHYLRTEKQALKAAFHDLVPQKILNRPKHPLKTDAVKEGGLEYRRLLVDTFEDLVTTF